MQGTLIWSSEVWLWLLLPLGVLVWRARVVWRPLPGVVFRHAFSHWLSGEVAGGRGLRQRLGLAVAGGMIVLALADPVWRTEASQSRPLPGLSQANGVLVVETSVTMLLHDGEDDSRLARAQRWLGELLALRDATARTGLITFAETAYAVLPPTLDRDWVMRELARLDPALAGRTDESWLEAVMLAAWQLEQTGRSGGWILVVSDGAQGQLRGELDQLKRWLEQRQLTLWIAVVGKGAEATVVDSATGGLVHTPAETALAAALVSADRWWSLGDVQAGDRARQALLAPVASSAEAVAKGGGFARDLSLQSYLLLVAMLALLLAIWPVRGVRQDA